LCCISFSKIKLPHSQNNRLLSTDQKRTENFWKTHPPAATALGRETIPPELTLLDGNVIGVLRPQFDRLIGDSSAVFSSNDKAKTVKTVEQHFNCLGMLRIGTIRNRQSQCECGILLEIWPSGGVLQSDTPLEKNEKFLIHLDGAELEAEVRNCEEDIYGYYIRFAVNDPWFPESYRPSYLNPDNLETHVNQAI
jgi:hypothetical protein